MLMAEFDVKKSNNTTIYPVHAEETSGLMRRCEPMLTPELLRNRFLKGIPLAFRDGQSLDDDELLKDRINLAVNEVEIALNVTVTEELFKDKLPFDRSFYKHYMHFRPEKRPIMSISQLAIVSADGENIFNIPAEWIETANFHKGQINVIPLLASYGVNRVQGAVGNAGIAFLSILENSYHFVPAYWQIKYTHGLANREGQIPLVVNQLIGVYAAIDIISEKAADDPYTSSSINQDGIGQSKSSAGAGKYAARIQDLEKKKEELTKKIKQQLKTTYFISNI
jgi:hypothetical protein